MSKYLGENILDLAKKYVNESLEKDLNKYFNEAQNVYAPLEELVNAVKDYTLRGGKRLRALLVLLGYWSVEPRAPIDTILPIMYGIEYLQSYLLVHDDIMDRDELRRGGPTLHIWFKNKCVEESLLGDCIHYGISQAILAGDYLEALAIATFSSANLDSDTLVKLIKRYSIGLRMVAYGQYLDVYFSYKPLKYVKEEDVLKIHELKTASYTVELPLHLGVIAAKGRKEYLELFTKYARSAGIAFQLRDDIIGLYGDPRITGKPVGSDVKEKKKTLLIVKAYELGSSDDKKFLEEIYDRKKPDDITADDILYVREIVKNTGSLDYNESLIKKLFNDSIGIIEESKLLDSEIKNVFIYMTKKLVMRKV